MADSLNVCSEQMPFGMRRTPRGPLVLLFYDGFEWRARQGAVAGLMAQGRRLARYLYRSIRRKQVSTGFYTAFVSLRTALVRYGCDVRVNDFATASAMPHYPIGIAGYPTVLDAVRLPNPTLFGPGDFGAPAAARTVASDGRMKRLIQPSDWFRDYYRPSCGDKVVTWFAGIDTDRWSDTSNAKKTIDVLIYDKIRWDRDIQIPAVLNRLTAHLDRRGLTYQILRYGHHHQRAFAAGLKIARSMAFLCEHETQGLAYQEALASNVPVFAWDEGIFVDPNLNVETPKNLKVSSVPYFDRRCGLTFVIGNLEPQFDAFWARRKSFSARDYVIDTLSMKVSARLYLELYCSSGKAAPIG